MNKDVLMRDIYSAPLMLAEDHAPKLESTLAALAEHKCADEMIWLAGDDDDGDEFWMPPGHYMARYQPYRVKDGVLQVPVKGILLNDFNFQVGSLATGYTYIRAAVDRGLKDPEVRGIALMVDSAGGQASGALELGNRLLNQRATGTKPIAAFSASYVFSAAYALACAAGKITMAPLGEVGSIGALRVHVDFTKLNERIGLTYTIIRSGKYKAEGHPDEVLSEHARKKHQTAVDEAHDAFVDLVVRARPDSLTAPSVNAQQSTTFTVDQGRENGLIDAVQPRDEALAAFAQKGRSGRVSVSGHRTAAAAPVKGDAHEVGVQQERARILAILGSEEAQGRFDTAKALVANGMPAEPAIELLAGLPKARPAEAPAATGGMSMEQLFEAAMADGNPEVGADCGSEPAWGRDGGDSDAPGLILQDYRAFTGEETRPKN